MRTSVILASAAALAGTALATPSAKITVEASHSGINNTSKEVITVPIGPVYTNSQALAAVSKLSLTGADGVALESITCTPYHATNGTGSGGLPFTSSKPSLLSTNTVQVGSIVCKVTSGSSTGTISAPAPGSTGSAGNNPSNGTTTLSTTYTPTSAPTSAPTSSSPPGTNGAMSSVNIPYTMSALLLGAAAFMFAM
ncbi:hypothetical protein JX265_003660 [Neoarthrinium moseri]|uniref:Uncharacterized protein n=1 Tax=Neoarthrinium moseri TaxID=1658444 RepID=A0A9Q0APG2_9PEZI|nr:hypothetical protein JX266_001158 [Neoarthrinium moseri]KAI1877652.1 hypothetical protein JX265_003660 [Neoarthrinium moseri]